MNVFSWFGQYLTSKREYVEEKAMVKYFQDLSQMVKGVRKELIFNVDEIGFQRWADKQKIKVIWQEEKKYDDKDDDEEREELEYMEEEIVDLKKEIEKIDEEKAELKKEIKRKKRKNMYMNCSHYVAKLLNRLTVLI